MTDGSQAPVLARTLARRHVELISLGGVIGAGLFVGSSVAIAAAGPAIVISYTVAGLLLLLIMRMLGEMVIVRPDIRAFTDFVLAGLGEGPGFVIGWTYWYVWTVVVAVESIAGAVLLHAWIPLPVWVMALFVIGIMWCVNILSPRTYGEFEFWFASIKVAAIVAFVLATVGFVFRNAHLGNPDAGLPGLQNGLMPHGPGAVVAGIATVFFSLTGAEVATIAAAESNVSTRVVARIAGGLIFRVALFYVLSVLLMVLILPWREVIPGVSPFTVTLQHMGHAWAAGGMSLVILTAVLSCLNSALYVSSRTLFALAAHHHAPNWLVTLNSRKAPARAVTFGAVVGAAAVTLATVSPNKAFAFLVNATGAIVLLVYLSVAAAYLKMRRSSTNGVGSAWRLAPYPAIVYVTAAGVVFVLVEMALSKEMAVQLYASTVPVVIACVAYGLLRRARRQARAGNLQNST